jgi:hypothetical protein
VQPATTASESEPKVEKPERSGRTYKSRTRKQVRERRAPEPRNAYSTPNGRSDYDSRWNYETGRNSEWGRPPEYRNDFGGRRSSERYDRGYDRGRSYPQQESGGFSGWRW